MRSAVEQGNRLRAIPMFPGETPLELSSVQDNDEPDIDYRMRRLSPDIGLPIE